MEKDASIQIVRIFSMFMIIICHLVQEFNNSLIIKTAQFFNVGVFIFLFLSGYLHGKKNIKNTKRWYLKKYVRICFPVYIFMIILFIIQVINKNFDVKYIFIYFFNIQQFTGGPQGAGHLWFITQILICYLITPLLKNLNNTRERTILIIIMLLAGIFTSYFYSKIGMCIFYVITYVLGYFYESYEKKFTINIFYSTCLIIVSLIIRVLALKFLDGTVLYECIIVSITHFFLCFGIFYIIRKICLERNFSSNKIIDWFDGISFYVYIVHYIFMVGPLRTMGFTENILINSILTVMLSFVFAIVLKEIDKKISNVILK